MTFEEKRQHILARSDVLDEVEFECQRQIEKWGVQSWPDGTGSIWVTVTAVLDPRQAKQRCDVGMKLGTCTYALILVEEVAEALFETSKRKLRKGLVQVAAVCVSWIGKIDRDLARGEE